MDNKEYIEGIVKELMADTEWKVPPQLRFFLVAELEWIMLGL